MLRRKVTEQLVSWKGTANKALLVTGARQVGKSLAIREFGKAAFATYYEANLALDAEARGTLFGARNATDFINRISLLTHTPLEEGNALVFIDEIQEYPEVVTLAKALVEDGRYRYAFSDSMLGTEFKGITSFPVGSVRQLIMRPLDFEEFSWAVGVGEGPLAEVRACLRDRREVPGYLHDALLRNFRAYLVAGGMPEVVQAYIDAGYSLTRTRALQSDLVGQYAQDISKYAGSGALHAREIFDLLPSQLEEDPHRFVFASIEDAARYDTYDRDFLWLVNAGVAHMVRQATEAKSPLRRTEVPGRFKLYQSDSGMLLSRYPQDTARAVYLDRRDQNLGGVYENAVAQGLAASNVPLWYYSSAGIGEVDFLMQGAYGRVIPIEVKSGRKVRGHAALNRLLNVREYRIRDAVVLSRNNVSQQGPVLYAPIYMTFCLAELTEGDVGDFTFAPAALG